MIEPEHLILVLAQDLELYKGLSSLEHNLRKGKSSQVRIKEEDFDGLKSDLDKITLRDPHNRLQDGIVSNLLAQYYNESQGTSMDEAIDLFNKHQDGVLE